MTYKRIFFAGLLLSLANALCGTSLTSQQALQRALMSSETTMGSVQTRIISKPQYQLIYSDSQSAPAYYIFAPTDEKGFIIVSGEDAVPAILGYSEYGRIDPSNIPIIFSNHLEQYVKQIEALRRNNLPNCISSIKGLENATPIPPLLNTSWGQNEPFNNYCPTLKGIPCLSGSPATGMAQIMKYHRYPAQGKGSNSYSWNGLNLETDFSTYYFDWDNMLNDYSVGYFDSEADAVASVIVACGLATETNFSNDISSATIFNNALAYLNYFDYDKNLFYAERRHHTTEDWYDLIYNQLEYVGPVQMYYQNETEELSFVCDGYDNNGYFHINWCNDGDYNGYFLLSNLISPLDETNYDDPLGFIGGIALPNSYFIHKEFALDSFDIYDADPSTRTFNLNINQCINNCVDDESAYLGLQFENKDTHECIFIKLLHCVVPFRFSFSRSILVELPQGFPNGSYTVTPAFCKEDDWYKAYVEVTNPQSFTLTITDDNILVDYEDPIIETSPKLEITAASALSDIYWNEPFDGKMAISNGNDIAGYVEFSLALFDKEPLEIEDMPLIYTRGNLLATGPKITLWLEGLESQIYTSDDFEFIINTSVDGNIPPSGEYLLSVLDKDGEPFSCLSWVNYFETSPIVKAESVVLNHTQEILEIGEILQLEATVYPENTNDKTIVWHSDNESVAMVNENGLVTAISAGSANIIAYCGEVYGICSIIVNEKIEEEIPVESLIFNITEKVLEIGETFTLTASIYPEDATNQNIIWGSTNVSVATVDNGQVTAISPGIALITAICDGQSAMCTVTVNSPYVPIESITITPNEATINVGETISLTATVLPTEASIDQLIWSSSNPSVATVDSGKVTGKNEGTAIIIASCDGISALCQITVNSGYTEVSSIQLSQTKLTIEVGQTATLTAKILPEDATNPIVTWLSDNTDVATVVDGVVTALSEGTAHIYAQADNVMAVCNVTVKPEPIVYSLSLSNSSIFLDIDETYQLNATLSPQNDEAVLVWTSSNPIVALIDQTGKVYAIGRGNATITVMYSNASASCQVVVGKDTQEIIWDQTFDNVNEGDEIVLTAYSTSGLPVEYGITEGKDIASISENILTLKASGTVEIYAYQNGDGTYRPAERVNKTIKVSAGISDAFTDSMKIITKGLSLTVLGLNRGTCIEVFAIDGKLIYQGKDHDIQLSCHGSYLLSINGKVIKIMI